MQSEYSTWTPAFAQELEMMGLCAGLNPAPMPASLGPERPKEAGNTPRAEPATEADTHVGAADLPEEAKEHAEEANPPKMKPPGEAAAPAEVGGALGLVEAELPVKVENAMEAMDAEQEKAGGKSAKGSKRKAGASPKQATGKPRAKLRHSEAGAVLVAQGPPGQNALGNGGAEVGVPTGTATTSRSCLTWISDPLSCTVKGYRRQFCGHPNNVQSCKEDELEADLIEKTASPVRLSLLGTVNCFKRREKGFQQLCASSLSVAQTACDWM